MSLFNSKVGLYVGEFSEIIQPRKVELSYLWKELLMNLRAKFASRVREDLELGVDEKAGAPHTIVSDWDENANLHIFHFRHYGRVGSVTMIH